MKFNIYFLVVGILSILFSFTHAINGHTNIFPQVDSSVSELTTRTIFHYIWHIITVENLIFGISFLIMAFYKDPQKVKFAAWLIAIVIIARWLIIFGTTFLLDKSNIVNILIDSIAIIIFAGLIFLGIRKNNKVTPA